MAHRFFVRIRLSWRKRFGVLPLGGTLLPLSEWFLSSLGKWFLTQEQPLIDEQLHNLFGYHLLQLSVAHHLDLATSSRISHKFSLYPKKVDDTLVSAQADFNHLPLPANSIDVAILHHVLDYSQSPHQVLREAAMSLISHGHLIVIGFNPWSLFGLRCFLARIFSKAPQWRYQQLRAGRVLDWLTVLDFEPVVVRHGCYLPLFINSNANPYLGWLDRLAKNLGLPCGGFYFIVARKDSFGMTPIRPQWQGYASLRGWGVIKILGRANRTILEAEVEGSQSSQKTSQ